MSRLQDFTPPIRQTDAERRRADLIAAESRPGFFQAVDDSVEEWWTNSLIRAGTRGVYGQFDPNFRIDEKLGKDLFEGIPTDLLPAFESAKSFTDAQIIRQQLLHSVESRQRLASLGWSGTALTMVSSVLDPAAYAAFAATGGFSAVSQGARMGRLLKAGIVTGGTAAAMEAAVLGSDPVTTPEDVLWAGAGGMAVAGIASAAGMALSSAFGQLKKTVEFQELVFAMGAAARAELTPQQFHEWIRAALSEKGLAYFKDVLDPEAHRQWVHDLIDNLDLPPETAAQLKALPPEEVLDHLRPASYDWTDPGLAADQVPPPVPPKAADGTEAPPPPPAKKRGDFVLDGLSDVKAAFAAVRRSFASLFGSSASPAVRKVGTAYVEDALLKKGGGKVTESASEWVNKSHQIDQARFYRVAELALREWARARGKSINPVSELAIRDEFFEEVGKAIRAPAGTYADGPVARVADHVRKLQAELLEMAQRHGVKGFDRVKENPTYLMRIWNLARLSAAEAAFGSEAVQRLFSTAIQQGSEGMAADAADKLARTFIKVIRNQDKWTDLDRLRLFSGEQSDTLAAVLREHGMDEESIKNIIYAVAPPEGDAGLSARAKRRLDIDEHARIDMPDGQSLGVMDLMESNAEAIFGIYSRQIRGAAAEAEIFRVMTKHFDPEGKGLPITSYDGLRSRIGNDLAGRGMAARDIDATLDRLDIVHKAVAGHRLNPDTKTSAVLRTIRGFNHLTLSGGFGIAQIPDVGNLIAESGFRVMMQLMPALKSIFSRAKSGQLSNELLEFIELATGLGTDRLTRQVASRFDEGAALREFGGGGLERWMRQGTRYANDLSFMAPINIGLQRMAGLAAAQKIANLAWANRLPSAKRLAALGLTEAEARTIAAQVKAHAKFEDGWIGKRLLNPNIDEWADQAAAGKFITAIDKWSRRVVQQNDIGQLHPFMTTEAGKTIFQFRTFVMAAWEKQFLSRVQQRDWTAFSGMMWGSFSAGLVYTGQKYVESLGRADAQEFREKYLSPVAIARAAVQRGAWSSILPGAIDTVWGATGGEPIFNARNTGLRSNYLTGNPTYNLIVHELLGATRGVGQAVRGEGFTEQDARHITNLLPFRRLMGVQNLIEAVNTQFPEERDP